MHEPTFPPEWQPLVSQAADVLRALALDETAKARFCSDPQLMPYLQRVAARYVAGPTIDDVLARIRTIHARGHCTSAEYMGESCRDEATVKAETKVFLDLIDALEFENLPCSISLDLSHIGSAINSQLGYVNACKIAAAAKKVGRDVMISMEGADRADNIHATYARLHTEARLQNVGITIAAKRYRTVRDLPVLMQYPGRIRLVKGAYTEPAHLAYARDNAQLAASYQRFARTLIAGGHPCSIATHDRAIQTELADFIERQAAPVQTEFESLMGLGTAQIDALQRRGFATREYAVFGNEYFLYVLNRIAEQPVRLYQALIDLMVPLDGNVTTKSK